MNFFIISILQLIQILNKLIDEENVSKMGKKKGAANKLAKMSEEERARYLQHRADIEEEARRRKQQLIAIFLKVFFPIHIELSSHFFVCLHFQLSFKFF